MQGPQPAGNAIARRRVGDVRAHLGDTKVIEYLNKGLRNELTAINQYWLHYRFLRN